MASQRYTVDEVITALRRSHGLARLAARLLGCSYQSVLNYARRYPEVQATLEDQRGLVVDIAECRLFEAIQRGEAWAISLCLRTLGRDRGYVVRHEKTTLADEEGLAALLDAHQHGTRKRSPVK
jgi:hypothetical protein